MANTNTTATLNPQACDRKALWFPLLQCLTQRVQPWGVWKNFGSAFRPGGDVDSIAPTHAWPAVTREWVVWARESKLGPVILCPHVPYLLHLIALHPEEPHFFEMDIGERKLFLGSTLFRSTHILPLMFLDEFGIRRLRPGAEGLFKLLLNGTRRGGRANWEAMRKKQVLELLQEDWEGVIRAATLFGSAKTSILQAANSVLAGDWRRMNMLHVESRSLARSLLEPWNVWNRLWFRSVKKNCPVIHRVFFYGRTVPDDREAWLATVRNTHEVIGLG